ncbi:MAG: UDP-3-O-(3-hydroxymyristoyl)glucosamine N-acyltransferase [Leptospiraceae bacterium]|nr:UDP-3-O-(3-hydroxymyristoyl)glucosamine N-acyltransferase [Leptospiraceae bacterium]
MNFAVYTRKQDLYLEGMESILLSAILQEFQSEQILSALHGTDVTVSGIAPVEQCTSRDLVFLGDVKYLKQLGDQRPGAAVVSADSLDAVQKLGIPCLLAPNVNLAQALLKQKYTDRDYDTEGWPRIHPSAIIHESAQIGQNVRIGPLASIARGVKIDADSVILSHAVIESGVEIGKKCVIHPRAVIGYNTQIGDNVMIKQGAVIGSEGFGFAQDEARHNHRIPQVGRVVIEDRVVIGALCTIERAAYTETRIKAGAVFDAHCHMAHGVEVGEDCIVMAHSVVAGSTKIGKRVIMSGQTGILDHLNITDDVILLHRAGVTRDVKQSGLYAWLPLMPLTSYLKNSTAMGQLIEMRKKVTAIEKKVDPKS